VTAVLAVLLTEEITANEAFRHALAAGSASCMELKGAAFSLSNYEGLLSLVTYSKEVLALFS